MKTIINLSVIIFLILSNASAQTMEIEIGALSKIEIFYIYGKIKVIGTNDNRIFLKVTKQKDVPKEFNSLKYDFKESNSNLDLHIENTGGVLKIYPSSKKAKLADYLIKVPNSFMVKIISNSRDIKNKTWSPYSVKSAITDTIFIQNMVNDIEIESSYYTILKIIDISGPIVANTKFGDVYIQFSSLNQIRPSSIKTFSGQINLILPQSVNCDIEQSSYSGNFNTEFNLNDLKVEPPDPKVRNKMEVTDDEADIKISGKINYGGVKLFLDTFSGDINLRKK
ncbi:hypothetical protein ES705_35153 [subsurface metagenome]